MALETRFTALLGISRPIAQAPTGLESPALAAAVSNAGGLGVLALSWCPVAQIPVLLEALRALTTRPFAVNLVLEWDQSERIDLALLLGVRIFSFFWGDPAPYVQRIHAQGGLVLCTVGSVDEARRAADARCDALVVQGQEAGGHVRGEVATMVLVPAIADAVPDLPLLAAGGIADGRGLAAALCLGADGVWLGTRFVATRQSRAHAVYKAAILAATENDTQYGTMFDGGWPSAPHRALINSTVKAWRTAGSPPTGERPGEGDIVGKLADGTPIPRYHEYPPDEMLAEGDPEVMCLYAGQSVGLIHSIDTDADALVNSIEAQALRVLQQKRTCMFNFVCLGTRDLERAARFYDAAMATLGHTRCDVSGEPGWDGWLGWGIYVAHGAVEFALWLCQPIDGNPASVGNGTMVGLVAKSWAEVDAFHAAGLANGGVSEGAPGLRLHYQPDFYAAYIRDPDGNKLACVCRGFTEAPRA